jgi:CBS domain containing-hemolysin-like protein
VTTTGWYLLAGVALLLTNGLFVGAEFAMVAARRTKIEQLAEGSDRASMALKSMQELSFMLAGAQLGITICSVGLGFVAEPAVARLLEPAIGSLVSLPPAVLHSVSFVIALTIVTFLHMVIGEMAPKNIAIAEPEKSMLWLAVPFRVFVNVLRPFVSSLNRLANRGTRLLGVAPVEERPGVQSAEEIGAIINDIAREGLLEDFQQRLLSGALGIRERDAGDVMVPRVEMVSLPLTATPAAFEQVVLQTGHSRIPVFAGDMDHVVGFFHAKDLLKVDPADRDKPLANELVRPMLVVPESRKVQPLLLDMRRERRHFALVVDEHGGTAGIVTIEDVVEELVGEIRDEYDVSELGIEQLTENRFLVPGTLRIHEAADHLGVALPEGDYETVAGFMMDRLGRVPNRRDTVDCDGWRLRVRSMHRRRVVQVLIEARAPGPG